MVLWRRWGPEFPHPEDVGVAVLASVALACAALVLWRDAGTRRWPGAAAGWPLLVAAALSVAGWTNLGQFHGSTLVHHWEQFHHVLGAKYFPELGYDGLYVASLAAEATANPGREVQPWVRDLRDDVVIAVDSPTFDAHLIEIRDRFTPARRAAFGLDNQVFLDSNNSSYLEAIRRDHGLNASPTWVAIARLFTAVIPVDAGGLALFGLLDMVLLTGAVGMLWRTFGSRVGALAVVLLGTSYLGRYWWIGGAFLRLDWLAAVIIGICLLERGRFAGAGAALAWAAALRLFPSVFLLGPLIALASQRRWGAIRRLLLGATIAGTLALAAGSLAGRGPGVWLEFADEITRHSGTWLTNNVGLANVVLYGPADLRREFVDFDQPEPWARWQERLDQRLDQRGGVIWLARAALLALFVLACRRVSPTTAAALGMTFIFTATLSTCYYWQMLALLVVLRSARVIHAVMLINLAMFGLHFASPAFEFRYGLFSWILLVFFAVLLVMLRRGSLLGEGDTPPVPVAARTTRPPSPSNRRRRRG